MKIAVLGATGPSGQEVVKEALKRGYEVTAIVRNPEKMTQEHERLKVVKANIFDGFTLVPHFEGQDAVLSCLGCGPSFFSLYRITFHTDSAKAIVAALRKAGVSRFLFMSAWYTKYEAGEPFMMSWVFKPLFLGQTMKNMGEMEDFMAAECQDIEYTSVRPPQLTNDPSNGKPVLSHEGQRIQAADGLRLHCKRADVARFMLDAAQSGEFKRKFMAIASGT